MATDILFKNLVTPCLYNIYLQCRISIIL